MPVGFCLNAGDGLKAAGHKDITFVGNNSLSGERNRLQSG
jgi:hypothetical protein